MQNYPKITTSKQLISIHMFDQQDTCGMSLRYPAAIFLVCYVFCVLDVSGCQPVACGQL